MKKTIYYLALGLAVLTSSCNKYDNYPGPTETLRGRILDQNGKLVQSEVSGDNGSGTRLRLLEISWSANPTPLLIATKQDGTYNNSKLFAATYKISAEGAFIPMVQTTPTPVDNSKTIELKGGTTTLDFNVEPWLNVEWVGEPVKNANGTITVQARVTRGNSNPLWQQDVTDIGLYVSPSQYVGNNNYDARYSTRPTYSGSTGTALLGTTITLTTSGAVLPKKDYFLRIGARTSATNNGARYFNYSDIKMVTIN